MFVRFRSARHRLRASLIETRRVEGKVRHEHIASLGTIDADLSIASRVAFWQQLHHRLDRLANRLDTVAYAKVLGEIHARIPMATFEEIRALQIENAEADEHLWRQIAELQAEQAEGNSQLATKAGHAAAEAKEQAANASTKAEAARDRVERLKRGEAVPGGLGKPVDIEQAFREAGWTATDFRRARQTTMISQLGGFEELLDEIRKRQQSAETTARRTVLHRRVVEGFADGRIASEDEP